jgi:signal transduction histidine kinase
VGTTSQKPANTGPSGPDKTGIAAGIALVPGALTSCVLITILTIMLAAFSSHPTIDPVLRTLYFAALYAAFHAIRHREPSLNTTAYRLLELGFLVLTLGFSAFAVFRITGLEDQSRTFLLLSRTFEKGAVYLLGVSLITYGILLFLPSLVEKHRVLRERVVAVEDSHKEMENHMVDADRYRALGELAAGIAHDLRNPLTIVKTAAESLARKERSPEEVAEHSKVIARNIERAERTIAALLDLGKPRSLSPRAANLAAVLAELVTLVNPEARRRKVSIHREGPSELTVFTDQKLLGQAILNLLLNAMQASGSGSRIFVKTRVFAQAGREFAAVIVEDRGSGLRNSDRGQLFSPFFTTKAEGTGLGLLSCRRILDDLGGGVRLFPRERGGARAVILLPMERVEAMA